MDGGVTMHKKELIVRGDKSVVPLLKNKAVGSDAGQVLVGRLHALWTLEGLGAVDKPTILAGLNDPEVQIIKAALRLSEPLLEKLDAELLGATQQLGSHKSLDVQAQLLLSLSKTESAEAKAIIKKILDKTPDDELLSGIQASLKKRRKPDKYGYKLTALAMPARKSIVEGATIFNSLCATCHGPEGQGLPTNIAPPLISKFKLIENKDEVIKIMLHGLKGPVDGKTYTDQMVPMGANTDDWIAAVLSYVRYDLCMRSFPKMNEGYLNWVIVTPEQVKKIREQNLHRTTPWTWNELAEERKKRQP